jgi:hypothetical protein
MNRTAKTRTMAPATARLVTWTVIGFCALALILIFQPFYKPLFGAGCLMVIAGGLVFNVMPFATPQHSIWRLAKVLAIVLGILAIAILVAIGFVELLL